MPGRLVVVSNRVGPVRDAGRAGGLAVAVAEALKDKGGVWFGWSGEVSERTIKRPTIEQQGNVTLATLHLSREDYEDYYSGFANTTLWPLFHYRLDLTAFDREYHRGYLRVNARFAQAIGPLLRADDVLWVHDYHFLAFGEELRRMECRQRMGFFLHIPFPATQVLTMLPLHDILVRALFAYDVVGFQTEADRQCFADYVVNEASGEILDDDRVRAFGRTIVAKAFPISIDTERFAEYAISKEAVNQRRRWKKALDNRLGIIGVDRLDYTKGLPERFRAFERLLRSYPENTGLVSYVQVAPPSRSDIPDYAAIRTELETLAGSINGEFSEFDWTPLRYINRSFGRRALAGIFRASRVGLVTPLRDGMNLVAKEYVAAQNPRNPGVLVLSRFAGAAKQLDGAIVVNPYDVEGVADALQTALNLSLHERRARWSAMFARLRVEDVAAWRNAFLERLRTVDTPM